MECGTEIYSILSHEKYIPEDSIYYKFNAIIYKQTITYNIHSNKIMELKFSTQFQSNSYEEAVDLMFSNLCCKVTVSYIRSSLLVTIEAHCQLHSKLTVSYIQSSLLVTIEAHCQLNSKLTVSYIRSSLLVIFEAHCQLHSKLTVSYIPSSLLVTFEAHCQLHSKLTVSYIQSLLCCLYALLRAHIGIANSIYYPVNIALRSIL